MADEIEWEKVRGKSKKTVLLTWWMNGGPLLSKMNRRAGRVSMKGKHLRDTQAKGSH